MEEYRYFCRDHSGLTYVTLVRPYKEPAKYIPWWKFWVDEYRGSIWESTNHLTLISRLAYSLEELPLGAAIKVDSNNNIVETFYR